MPEYIKNIFKMIDRDIKDLYLQVEDLQRRLSELEKKEGEKE